MKRIPKKILLIILSVIMLSTGAVVFFSCQPKDNSTPPPENVYTITLTPPTDGTTPESYSGLDNLAYMAGRLAARKYYHSETEGLVDTITKQKVTGAKDYYNGLLITKSVSTSTFASVAQQKFYGDGKVVIRGPKYGKSKWDGLNTEWSNEKPIEVLDKEQYIEKYGLWASEFSDYVLNEETILEISDLTKTDDGYYTQTFTLDCDKATYYQKRNMRTMGGLDTYPEFSSAEITFTFDDTWAIIRADIVEKYKVSVAVLNVSCKATTSICYYYEESAVDVSAYEEYFKNYADADVTGEAEKELGVVDYLQKGFLEGLSPDSVMNLSVTVDENELNGKLSLNLSENFCVKASFGDLALYVDDNGLYLQYKDFCGKLALSDLTGLIGDGISLNVEDLLEQIGSGEIVKDEQNVAIYCKVALGEMQIPLSFNFTENDKQIAFVNVSANIEIGGITLNAYLAMSETEDSIADVDTQKAVDIKPYVTSILNLVKNKSFNISANYANDEKEFAVSGSVYVNADVIAINGELTVEYKNWKIPVSITYFDNAVYLNVFDVSVKTTVQYLKSALSYVFEYAQITIPEDISIDLSDIISVALKLDYNAIIKTLSLTETNLSLTINLDSVFKDLTLGDIFADYDLNENAFTLSVYGITAKLQGTEKQSVTIPENAVDIKTYVESITEFVNKKSYSLEIDYNNAELELNIDGNVYIDVEKLAISGTVNVEYKTLSAPIEFKYVDGVAYLSVYDINVKATKEYLGEAIEKVLSYAGITLSETTEINVEQILEVVLKLDYETNVKVLSLTDEELTLKLNVDNLIDKFTLGDITAKYSITNSAISLSVYGVNAKLECAEKQSVTVPENAVDFIDAKILEKFVQPVQSLLKTDDIVFAFDFKTKILDIDMGVSLIGEVKFADGFYELYIKAQIFVDGYADETVEIVFADGVLSLVYEGYVMQVSDTQIDELAQRLGSLFSASNSNTTKGFNATVLLFSEDGIDLNALIESLKLLGREENDFAILNLAVNLGIISADLSEISADISTDGSVISCALIKAARFFGLDVNSLSASLKVSENEYSYDISSAIVCNNAFEFVLQAYAALADTNYLNIAIDYDSELITAKINGLFEFVPVADSAAMNINFDISAEVHTFVYDTEGQKVSDGSHYLNMVTVEETAYISYSLFGYNADKALYVSIPVEQLFEIGEIAMPLLTPILGISEDAFYLDLVNNLLSMTYTKFSTEICNAIEFADLLKLIDGIIAQTSNGEKSQKQSVNISEIFDIFAISKNENGETVIAINNIAVSKNESLSLALTALKTGTIVADTSKAYIDISTISDLLKDVLGAYAYAETGYEISGDIGLKVLGLELDLTVRVTLKIGLDANGDVFLNVNIKANGYNNLLAGAMCGTQVIVNGDTETDITIKDGNVYITRVQSTYWGKKNWISYGFLSMTPEYNYRKMTLSEFGADAMNQIFWAINLSDGMQEFIVKQIENSSDKSESTYDTGDMVKSYLLTDNVYKAELNLGAIVNDSAIGDLSINITREQTNGREYYDLTKLSGSIKLVTVITATFTLNHTSIGNPVDFSIVDTNISRVNANV